MNKKSTVIHYSLLSLSLLYSFFFYNSIALELAIMAIIFDLVKPNMFITALQSKGIKRNVFSILVTILVVFNLLAISSSFINKYNKESVNKTLNIEYTKQQDKLKQLKSNIANIETELKNYPTLESYTAKSPKWEDKTVLNQTWQQGKQDITYRLNTANAEYSKELSKKVDKYNITDKKNGYNAIFTALSQKLNVKISNLVLLIYILFAVMLEILIFYTKTLSVKESKNYVKSTEEMTIDLVKQMNYEWHKNYLQLIKNNFDKNLNQGNQSEKVIIKVIEKESKPEKVEQEEIETEKEQQIETEEIKQIEEPKEEVIEETPLFQEKILNLEEIEQYFNKMIEMSDKGIAKGVRKTATALDIDTGTATRIFEKLKNKQYIKTVGIQTKILKNEFNPDDFEREE